MIVHRANEYIRHACWGAIRGKPGYDIWGGSIQRRTDGTKAWNAREGSRVFCCTNTITTGIQMGKDCWRI